MKISKDIESIVGIDEAGRGPLAGPVSIGLVLAHKDNLSDLSSFCDSKSLKEEEREELYKQIFYLKKAGKLNFSSTFVSEKIIDEEGITYAVRNGINRILRRFDLKPKKSLILLDGLLKAPDYFPNQKTVSKGDKKVKIIGAASIVAKVKRDRKMRRLAEEHPQYNFHKHKGYGTKEHYKKLKKHGICRIHRKSFLSPALEK